MTETPSKPPVPKGKMLPGVAGISLFLLFLTLINVFGALQNAFGSGAGKIGVLILCSMLVAGLFGLLRMARWGWAITCGGTVLLASGYCYAFSMSHAPFYLIEGFFMLAFFLYLVRPEVRDRML